MAETRVNAEKAFDIFIETYKAKYPKAVQCLEKDREELLEFCDSPADHWAHIRTSNPIIDLCHSSIENEKNTRLREPENDSVDGLQIENECLKKLAKIKRIYTIGRCDQRNQIR